jgi:hypothetical protein
MQPSILITDAYLAAALRYSYSIFINITEAASTVITLERAAMIRELADG